MRLSIVCLSAFLILLVHIFVNEQVWTGIQICLCDLHKKKHKTEQKLKSVHTFLFPSYVLSITNSDRAITFSDAGQWVLVMV